MVSRDTALAFLRASEQTSLRHLPEPGQGVTKAATIEPIGRELYAAIEQPPTRHRVFYVRTEWSRDGLVALTHAVWVKDRQRFRPVIDERPGVFGGGR